MEDHNIAVLQLFLLQSLLWSKCIHLRKKRSQKDYKLILLTLLLRSGCSSSLLFYLFLFRFSPFPSLLLLTMVGLTSSKSRSGVCGANPFISFSRCARSQTRQLGGTTLCETYLRKRSIKDLFPDTVFLIVCDLLHLALLTVVVLEEEQNTTGRFGKESCQICHLARR